MACGPGGSASPAGTQWLAGRVAVLRLRASNGLRAAVAVLRLRASNGLRAAWQCFACGQAMACGPRGSASPAGKQWPAGRRGSILPAGKQRSACWRVVRDRQSQRFVIPIGNLFSDTTKEPHYFP